MPKITVLPHPELAPGGAVIVAPESMSICDALLAHHIEIEHACGQVGACSTCHVVVAQGFESLNGLGDNEEDMLDQAWGLQPHSRLSCQAAGIIRRLPRLCQRGQRIAMRPLKRSAICRLPRQRAQDAVLLMFFFDVMGTC